MVTLKVMCGYPRSGKSTWIKEHKKNNLVVEPDWIRRVILGHQYHRPAEPIIWLIADSFIRICLSQGQDVILDGTNLSSFVREKYITLAKEMNARVECIYVATPMEECVKRNEISPEGQKLPVEALLAKEEIFKHPTTAEGFDKVSIVINHTQEQN